MASNCYFLIVFLNKLFNLSVAVKTRKRRSFTIQILGGKNDGFFLLEQVKNIVSGDTAILSLNLPLNDWHSV